ncbi:MAG TPA: hypothetical protein VHZ98_05540 [Galbitalea sp.]|jgi:hypothetical protein|nr:hypothetical protein [Galbitalea sp.]
MTKRFAAFCAALLSFVVFLVVALWGAQFGIDGSISRSLLPGSTAPINIRISNPHFYPITVDELNVRISSISTVHKGETCSIDNFTVHQAKPVTVHLAPYAAVSLGSVSPSSQSWPSVHLTGNQAKLDNGCQGATLHLTYTAAGSWWSR